MAMKKLTNDELRGKDPAPEKVVDLQIRDLLIDRSFLGRVPRNFGKADPPRLNSTGWESRHEKFYGTKDITGYCPSGIDGAVYSAGA